MLILKISKYRNFRTSLGDLFQCLTSCLTGNSLATASDKQQHLELEWHSELPGLLNECFQRPMVLLHSYVGFWLTKLVRLRTTAL